MLAAMPGATPVALERVAEGLNQPIQNSAWSSAGHRVALGLLALLGVLLLVWMTSLGQGLRERLGWPEAAVVPETDMAAAVPGDAVVASAPELAPQPTQASPATVALPVQAASASIFGTDSAPAAASAALPAAASAALSSRTSSRTSSRSHCVGSGCSPVRNDCPVSQLRHRRRRSAPGLAAAPRQLGAGAGGPRGPADLALGAGRRAA